jgi:hypothetical protein
MQNIDGLELAKIIGEPKDPRKPYPTLISQICQVDTAEPEDYTYYFDALVDTDKIYIITSNGAVTQENVTPDTPTLLSFTDVASPEYYIKLTDYLNRKESIFARKNATINRAMNSYETYKIIQLLAAAASGTGKQVTLGSGFTRFSFPHAIAMIEDIQDYGDMYKLVVGADCDNDIKLWNWNDNKYQSVSAAFADLGIEKTRISLAGNAAQFSVDLDNSGGVVATDILGKTKAYMVAVDTELGKPLLFVRKKLDSVKQLGGVLYENAPAPERIIFTSPNPVSVVGGSRYLAVSITGYEQITAATINPYAISEFTRA